jgi:MurNAc alpha-1-phosphate uridylyltransferase
MHDTAMILAAGRGERMRPLTDHTPKPLLEAGGKALIVWHIERLARAGFSRIVVNHAHLGAQIEAALGDGARWGVEMRYSAEASALETAGGIATALPLIDDAVFPVVNGDVYSDFDYARLRTACAALGASDDLAHLILIDNPAHHPAGDFSLVGKRVCLPPDAPRLTFAGLGVYRRRFFDSIAPNTRAALAPLLRDAIADNRVSGEHFPGRWVDVGTPERLRQLDEFLKTVHAT